MGTSMGVQFHPEVDTALLISWVCDGEPLDPLFAELGVDPVALVDTSRRMKTGRPRLRRADIRRLGGRAGGGQATVTRCPRASTPAALSSGRP